MPDNAQSSTTSIISKYEMGQVLLIDKPLNWTSFDVVNKLKHKIRHTYDLKKIKIGHAGTLDPLASGLLIICTGKMTKSIENFQNQEKIYTGEIVLGGTTPSYDAEFEPDVIYPIEHITETMILDAANKLTGEIDQTPPKYSAIKVNGNTAYSLARKGKEFDIKSRKITIYSFDIIRIQMPRIFFRVRCGKGTYIRTLAHDFGILCQSGAYLGALRRENIGDYSVDDALNVEAMSERIERGE